jgi:hypothetical protein
MLPVVSRLPNRTVLGVAMSNLAPVLRGNKLFSLFLPLNEYVAHDLTPLLKLNG